MGLRAITEAIPEVVWVWITIRPIMTSLCVTVTPYKFTCFCDAALGWAIDTQMSTVWSAIGVWALGMLKPRGVYHHTMSTFASATPLCNHTVMIRAHGYTILRHGNQVTPKCPFANNTYQALRKH